METARQKALRLIKKFEGCRLVAYLCSAKVWTIGWGHTKGVKAGDKITQEEADNLLEEDMDIFYKGVLALDPFLSRYPNRLAAITSFSFNVGIGAYSNSTLRKKLIRKDIEGAANEFLRWNKAGGKVVSGLVRRREEERKVFLEDGTD